jgi:hypothetical protein
MARPARYEKLDFTPTKGAAQAASRGLALRQTHNRGGTVVGVARARDLAARKMLTPSTVRRMVSYFARHEVDKRGKGWADRDDPSAGFIAWQLWGGDPGRRWAQGLARRMQKIDEG